MKHLTLYRQPYHVQPSIGYMYAFCVCFVLCVLVIFCRGPQAWWAICIQYKSGEWCICCMVYGVCLMCNVKIHWHTLHTSLFLILSQLKWCVFVIILWVYIQNQSDNGVPYHTMPTKHNLTDNQTARAMGPIDLTNIRRTIFHKRISISKLFLPLTTGGSTANSKYFPFILSDLFSCVSYTFIYKPI